MPFIKQRLRLLIMTKTKMNKYILAEKRGRRAENLARFYLMLKGFRILNTRYKTKVGEIDIIAKRFKTVHFIEVKARNSIDACKHSVSEKSKERIKRAASLWLQTAIKKQHLSQNYSLKFDLIAIVPRRFPAHIMDAWR